MASPPEGSLSFGRDFYFPNFSRVLQISKIVAIFALADRTAEAPIAGYSGAGAKT